MDGAGAVCEEDASLVACLPDVHTLFSLYNERYFEGLLAGSTVEWSDRLTLSAGICHMRQEAAALPAGTAAGVFRHCAIRLSRPLLRFRPFSDTIDTLLHEMIHAYLWIASASTPHSRAALDRNGHGPAFLQWACIVNEAEGSNVTVYHTFHDEVAECRRHVWKCDGPCAARPPYYGIVRRAMNRPPQRADWWFAGHAASCGGTYSKVAGPMTSPPPPPPPPRRKEQPGGRKRAAPVCIDLCEGEAPCAGASLYDLSEVIVLGGDGERPGPSDDGDDGRGVAEVRQEDECKKRRPA